MSCKITKLSDTIFIVTPSDISESRMEVLQMLVDEAMKEEYEEEVFTSGLFAGKRTTRDDLKDIYSGIKSQAGRKLEKARDIIKNRQDDGLFQIKARNIIEDARKGKKFQYNPNNY